MGSLHPRPHATAPTWTYLLSVRAPIGQIRGLPPSPSHYNELIISLRSSQFTDISENYSIDSRLPSCTNKTSM